MDEMLDDTCLEVRARRAWSLIVDDTHLQMEVLKRLEKDGLKKQVHK